MKQRILVAIAFGGIASAASAQQAVQEAAPPATSMPVPTNGETEAAPQTAPPPTVSVPAGPVLWQKIHAGMSAEQVRAIHPAEPQRVKYHAKFTELDGVAITEKCKAEVNIHHAGGVVDKIVIKGDGSLGGRCSDTVLTGLSSKYGQPLSESSTSASILAREGRIYVWTRDGVTLRFKRFTNGVFGGGGLGQASWELTYTTVGEDLAL